MTDPTPPAETGDISRICDDLVVTLATLSPMLATSCGIAGHDDRLDDLSPEGTEEFGRVTRAALRDLGAAQPRSRQEEIAALVVSERLEAQLAGIDSGWTGVTLNTIASPVQEVRSVFDLMPTETEQDLEQIARRLRAVPACLRSYTESLRAGAGRGQVAAARQVAKSAEQASGWGGGSSDGSSDGGFFSGLAESFAPTDPALGAELAAAAGDADAAYLVLAEYLRDDLLPHAPQTDPVGIERYELGFRDFLGASFDLQEIYEWGWSEFLSLEREMADVAERIAPGAGPAGAAAALDADLAYQLRGSDGLQRWMQELSDRAVDELGGTHFEIAGPLRTLACKIAPPGGGLGAYYTSPSDDFSRPGTMWWSVDPARETFSTWRETTTVYHEGVPGHHLQLATAVARRDLLNDYQRLLSFTSGHGEGWALYAERLMAELGYLDDDGDRLGLLDSQLFRAARVVLDIGMHLQLPIPAGTGFHEGERWTGALGLEFLTTRTLTEPDYAADEIDRYLGWPGQAPAYKVGERVWLAGRDRARARHGAAFDPRSFHTRALAMGGMGLAPLAELLDTL